MIAYLLFGVLLLIGSVLLVRWFIYSEPRQVLSVLRWVAAFVGGLLLLVVLWGGARQLLAVALPLLLPLLVRLPYLLSRWRSVQGPAPGQTSTVETRFLRMTLDHDTGEMQGTVREGRFRGRYLSELDEDELIALWRDCRAEDEESTAVLEAWLDRVHGHAWRQAAGLDDEETASEDEEGRARGERRRSGRAGEGGMTREEAYQILGLQPGASPEEIRGAHRRLMRQYHPDSGGSNYLAAKINQAKEILLGR